VLIVSPPSAVWTPQQITVLLAVLGCAVLCPAGGLADAVAWSLVPPCERHFHTAVLHAVSCCAVPCCALQEAWQTLWRASVVPKLEEELKQAAKDEDIHRWVL
jgi:hypothetical protein